jgi:hypothetical protein
MKKRSEIRSAMHPRYWHIILCAIAGTGIFVTTDMLYMDKLGELPNLRTIWGFAIIVPLLIGTIVTLGAGGAALWKRIAGAALCATAIGVSSAVVSGLLGTNHSSGVSAIAIISVWRAFVFTTVGVLSVLLTEIKMPEPR